MEPMDPNYQSPTPPTPSLTPEQMRDEALQKVKNPLGVMSPGERVLCHIQRHPFGLISLYVSAGFLLVLTLIAAVLIPHYATALPAQDKSYLVAGAVLVAVIIVVYMYIAVTVYNGNRWIVTSDSITQITQTGLFRKQSSQLSLGNLEDVTFEQENMLETMFGFGTLHVETAGEHSKFVFPFCPTPQKCAVEIIQAHEHYMALNPESASKDNQGINTASNGMNSTSHLS